MHSFLVDCVSAIEAEIAFIEKDGGKQSYDLVSGQREVKSTGALYIFLLADALRLPEDASGSLRVEGTDVSATVVSQEGSRVWLLLESVGALPAYIPTAKLVVNETELLTRLKEKIEELSATRKFGLGPKVFGKEPARVGYQAPPSLDSRIAGQTATALSQCIGSEVTFLWGPPGTGKTFTIAALVACLAELGETVLVTSHTHAAVEQALWALLEPPANEREAGYLHGSNLIEAGRILKVGVPKSEKIPPKVCLEKYLDEMAQERAEKISILEQESDRVAAGLDPITEQLATWAALAEVQGAWTAAVDRYEKARTEVERQQEARSAARLSYRNAQTAVEQARQSFFLGRSGRVQKARDHEERFRVLLQEAERATGAADAAAIKLHQVAMKARDAVAAAGARTEGLSPPAALEEALASDHQRLNDLRAEIHAIKLSGAASANDLVGNAVAVFATLSKLYRDRNLINDQTWDTVIIDEASMAMLPLIAYAAARASRRVIVVGDMYQLPPIVRSDRLGAGRLLGTDIFELRGITKAIDTGENVDQLAKLMIQRRMHPEIASLSRQLIEGYRELQDDTALSTRTRPEMTSALGTNAPLVAVDISRFNAWSGKLPESLSRFNFVSGQVAVELASLYAARVAAPDANEPPRIGIVTPYAAQRRFLSKLIQALQLERWVVAGTVHTFQGNECDVIIFDSVLGEPHWTARFTNPANLPEVRRDLNVAVTRTRHQFVFVGDQRWLKRNAKAGSGFGKLWSALQTNADHLDAAKLVGDGFRARVAKSVSDARGWDVSQAGNAKLFTEKDFYPAFANDLRAARDRVVLYTPYIGKTRWPEVEPCVAELRERRIDVYLLHKPLTDAAWREGDPEFGRTVFKRLQEIGVCLVPMSGVHAKTIVVDGEIVYEGSLNWASQVASYEHMWRFESKDMADVIERMLQLKPIVAAFGGEASGSKCPNCGGPLVVVNQAGANRGFGTRDLQPVKLGCLSHETDRSRCPSGYLRRVDARAPFLKPPTCPQGNGMQLVLSRNGKPWSWKCSHGSCRPIRWAKGDCQR